MVLDWLDCKCRAGIAHGMHSSLERRNEEAAVAALVLLRHGNRVVVLWGHRGLDGPWFGWSSCEG